MRPGPGLVVAAAAAVALPSSAAAFFAPGATPLSVSVERREQADDSTQFADLSSDGRFVAFQTQARNLFADDDPDPEGRFRRGGIFRRQIDGGLELVAAGTLFEEVRGEQPRALIRGAENPSISGDGRYVAFSTGERLVPADTNDEIDAYVRDMAVAASAVGAYDLVSARDATDVPAAYAEPASGSDFPGRNPGSEVTRGTAISDDGRRVVFSNQVASDLPQSAAPDTPPFQVLVRDRAADRTVLVTRGREDGEAVPLTNAGPSVVSADGTTVAWAGVNAPAQVRLLAGEPEDPGAATYLWQRVADTPATSLRDDAPTRRITGIADPDQPGCETRAISSSPTADGPCYGPLSQQESNGAPVTSTPPALSGDGYRVLFVTGSSPRPIVQFPSADLYLTDMRPGVTRRAGTVELTRDTADGAVRTGGPVEGVTLSAGGRYALMTTRRTRFLLPALRLISPERTTVDRRELELVDLQDRTIETVVRTLDGGELDADVDTQPTISATGDRMAFVSGSAQLFRGDANEKPDAFVITRSSEPVTVEPPAPEPEVAPSFEAPLASPTEDAPRPLSVFVRKAPRGQIRLLVRAPKAGSFTIEVRGRLPGRTTTRQTGEARIFAGTERTARRRGDVVVSLKLATRYAQTLRRARRLRAQASIDFEARDGTQYERRLGVVFTAPKAAAKKKPRSTKKARRRSGRR